MAENTAWDDLPDPRLNMPYLLGLSEDYTLTSAKDMSKLKHLLADLTEASSPTGLADSQAFLYDIQERLTDMTRKMYQTLPGAGDTTVTGNPRFLAGVAHTKAALSKPDAVDVTKTTFRIVAKSLETLQESVSNVADSLPKNDPIKEMKTVEAEVTAAFISISTTTAGLIAGLQRLDEDIRPDAEALQAAMDRLGELKRHAIQKHDHARDDVRGQRFASLELVKDVRLASLALSSADAACEMYKENFAPWEAVLTYLNWFPDPDLPAQSLIYHTERRQWTSE